MFRRADLFNRWIKAARTDNEKKIATRVKQKMWCALHTARRVAKIKKKVKIKFFGIYSNKFLQRFFVLNKNTIRHPTDVKFHTNEEQNSDHFLQILDVKKRLRLSKSLEQNSWIRTTEFCRNQLNFGAILPTCTYLLSRESVSCVLSL